MFSPDSNHAILQHLNCENFSRNTHLREIQNKMTGFPQPQHYRFSFPILFDTGAEL